MLAKPLILSIAACALGQAFVPRAHADDKASADKTSAEHRQKKELQSDVLWRLHVLHTGEIAMAQLGKDRARNPELRDFSDKLVDDHRKANKKLLELAGDKDWCIIPTNVSLSDAQHDSKTMDRLRELHGTEIDRELVSELVKGHERAIEAVRQDRKLVIDDDLRKSLDDLLPALQQHLDRARALRKAVGDVRSSKK